MPRAITLGDLKTGALRLANLSSAQFQNSSELRDYANSARCEVLALLSEAAPPDYESKTFQITTTAGTWSYTIANYVQDFGWLTAVYFLGQTDGTGVAARIPIRSILPRERGAYTAPGGAVTVEIEYTPLPDDLDSDSDTMDGLFGYEELVKALMARDLCIKQRQDYPGVQQKIMEMRERIMKEANNRDRGQPRFMGRSGDYYQRGFLPGAVGIRGYRLRGDTIELYQPSTIYW